MLADRIEKFINENADEKKAKFDKGLIISKYEIKGIVTKTLENFARQLAKEGTDICQFPLDYYEEIVLAGMVIAYSKISDIEKIEKLKYLLPYIDNWGACDTIVGRLKGLENQKEFFVSLLNEKNQFYIRVGIVWLMRFALKEDLQNLVTLLNERVKNNEYYVEMALAWCYAEAFIYDFDFMYQFLQGVESKFVQLKSISKACESFRVGTENKEKLRLLRKSIKES